LYNPLSLLLIATVSVVLIVPTYQVTLAQGEIGTQGQLSPILAVILGGIIGAASSLIGTALTNRHNMKVKKQELKHSLSVELIKHRIDCYALVIKYLEPVPFFTSKTHYKDFLELTHNLEKWNEQEKGGLLMSENSRKLYRDLIIKSVKAGENLGNTVKERADSYVSTRDAEQLQRTVKEFKMSLLFDIGVLEE
jgi:hypothetical protein